MLQNMYFGREIFTWNYLSFCVVDFRKVESTLFHDSSTLIGVELHQEKNGVTRIAQDKTIAEEPADIQQKKHKSDYSCKYAVKV